LKRSTSIIVKAVKNYFKEVQDTSIKEVFFCDQRSYIVDRFTEAMETEWGAQNVKRVAAKSDTGTVYGLLLIDLLTYNQYSNMY